MATRRFDDAGPAQAAPLDLFVEGITHVDCGLLDPEHGLVGRTWLVDIVLTGRRDDQGMLFDFGPAKREIKAEIDRLIDHRLLVPTAAANVYCDGERIRLERPGAPAIDYAGPASGVALLTTDTITAAWLADWLTERLRHLLPANVDRLALTLYEEPIDEASYHYCHGLRCHDGNCQRIGHGHRCKLAIHIDDEPRPELARDWAARWQGVFIGQRADLCDSDDPSRCHFAYRAGQGDFSLALDANRCVLLDGPPTVENIADHIAGELAREMPGRTIAVRAYEGIGKGAIAHRE